jgi:hypothetical protein
VNVALALVEAAGLRPARVRSDRVTLRCPFHRDRRPSAAVLSSGVLVCSAGCGSLSPFAWLVALGRSPADVMAELERLGLRDGDRPERRRPAAASRAPASSPVRQLDRPAARAQATAHGLAERPAPTVLDRDVLERLEVARFERRRFDARLAELRGFAPNVLDRAGVAIGLPAAYGFRGPRAALDELRLLVPVQAVDRRAVGLLAIAANPERRHEPKVLALPGTPRLPLALADLEPADSDDEPLAPILVVTEGELDALTAASAGLRAIGVPGIGGYARHAPRIAALVGEVALDYALLIPDGDAAGRRAFAELAAAIEAAGASAVLADVLDDGADVGAALVALAAQLGPGLSPAERRRKAGRRLLDLAKQAT